MIKAGRPAREGRRAILIESILKIVHTQLCRSLHSGGCFFFSVVLLFVRLLACVRVKALPHSSRFHLDAIQKTLCPNTNTLTMQTIGTHSWIKLRLYALCVCLCVRIVYDFLLLLFYLRACAALLCDLFSRVCVRAREYVSVFRIIVDIFYRDIRRNEQRLHWALVTHLNKINTNEWIYLEKMSMLVVAGEEKMAKAAKKRSRNATMELHTFNFSRHPFEP